MLINTRHVEKYTTEKVAVTHTINNMSRREKQEINRKQCHIHSKFPWVLEASYNHFWERHHTVLHTSCIILYSHQQCTGAPLSAPPCQHLLFSVVLIAAILMGARWCLVVLVPISLMTSDAEQLLMCWRPLVITILISLPTSTMKILTRPQLPYKAILRIKWENRHGKTNTAPGRVGIQ